MIGVSPLSNVSGSAIIILWDITQIPLLEIPLKLSLNAHWLVKAKLLNVFSKVTF